MSIVSYLHVQHLSNVWLLHTGPDRYSHYRVLVDTGIKTKSRELPDRTRTHMNKINTKWPLAPTATTAATITVVVRWTRAILNFFFCTNKYFTARHSLFICVIAYLYVMTCSFVCSGSLTCRNSLRIDMCVITYLYVMTCSFVCSGSLTCHNSLRIDMCYFHLEGPMGWLWLVGSLKIQVSSAEYSLFYRALLQKRPIILRSLLIVATP